MAVAQDAAWLVAGEVAETLVAVAKADLAVGAEVGVGVVVTVLDKGAAMKWARVGKVEQRARPMPIAAKRATRKCFTCGREMAARIDESDVMCRKCMRNYRKKARRAAKKARKVVP